MNIEIQALRVINVIDRLENCINAIMGTGDLSEWMSADGIALLNDTLRKIRQRKPVLARLVSTPPDPLEAAFSADDLETEIESYDSLYFHLMSTLKIAQGRR